MGAVVHLNNGGVGSTNVGVGQFLYHRVRRNVGDDEQAESIDYELDDEKISRFGEKFGRKRSLEEFRSDTLSDISSGLNVLASGIRVITTILSLFGADTVDRNDNFDDAVGTMMSLGATVLKFGVTKMLETPSTSSSISSVNKVGEAASTTQMTPEEIAHQQKVQAFISKLSPEQIKLQQQLVQDHVKQQAEEQNLSSVQAAQLLSETLQHNGLPQINSPVQNTIANVASSGEGLVTNLLSSVFGNKVGLPAGGAPVEDHGDYVPGLPKPGTLEHTITLALFKAQQSLNQMLSGNPGTSNQPAIDNKLGVAAGADVIESAEDSSGGILATVAALPQSVGGAAFQLLKFITPPTSQTASTSTNPGVTYSEVTTGPDPTYAALGLLGTGALGTVLYSYVAADSDLTASATALAKGAVDAIKRNDIVQVATDAISSVTGNKFEKEEDPGNVNYNYYDQENDYDNVGYSDYRHSDPSPNYPEYKDYLDYSYADPYTEYSDRDPYQDYKLYQDYVAQPAKKNPTQTQKYPHSIPDKIQFYEPDTKVPEVPFEPYTEEHSPWELMQSGQSTDHLYRSFKT